MHPAQHNVGSRGNAPQRRCYRRGCVFAQVSTHLALRAAFCLSFLAACHNSAPAAQTADMTALMRQHVTFLTESGDAQFWLEQALTPKAQARGLMFRRSLNAAGGMIFAFTDEAPRQFWMKNTYIPLDMIFVGTDQHVVGVVHNAEPQSLTERGPAAPCRYVIELAAGTAQRLGIHTGTEVRIDAVRPKGAT